MKDTEKREYSVATFKGLIGAIPYAGTLINEFAFEARSRVKQSRINNFIEEFSDYIGDETKESINIEALKKDEFGDVFEELMISVSKTSARHKIKIFKRILKNQIQDGNQETDHILRYIQITNLINSAQFQILTSFNSLSDKVLNYQVRILQEERNLPDIQQMLHKEKEMARKGYANNVTTYEKRLKETQQSIASKRKALSENINPNDSRIYNMSRENFLVEVHDLISKGLVFDHALNTDLLESNQSFGLTKLGRNYIKYVETSED